MRTQDCTKTTKSPYSSEQLTQGGLIRSLLSGSQVACLLSLPLKKTKNTRLLTVSTQTARMANPDKERTNQKARIFLKTTLQYKNRNYIVPDDMTFTTYIFLHLSPLCCCKRYEQRIYNWPGLRAEIHQLQARW